MYKVIVALVMPLLLLAACGGAGGGSNPTGPTNPTNPSNPAGSFPAELSGIWQNTLASSGNFRNPLTGVEFTMTEGYSAQLKVKANGEFYFAHYSQGVSPNCSLVSFFDQMTGLAEFSNNRLILRPRERRLDVRNCAQSGSFNQPLDTVTFEASVSEYETFLDTTLQMELTGGPYPLKFKLLNRTPPGSPPQPPQPQDFQLGQETPYQEILGLWGRYETSFYNPQTGAYQFPGCCGENRFLRFTPEGYELGMAFINASLEGVCKKDLIYYEKGQALFKITHQRGSDTVQGDVRLRATQARLIVRIRECKAEDGVREYTLEPLTGYYRWSYTFPSGGEAFMLGCQYPGHPWRFPVCYDANPWYTYQRR
jgi:hypothetical protein